MHSYLGELSTLFQNATEKAFPSLPQPFLVEITESTQEKFGHYQCNSAMKIAKLEKSNPRTVAETLIKHLEKTPLTEKIWIEGPGFINISIHPHAIESRLQETLTCPRLGIEKKKEHERVVIDFSSPNIAKEMHVGHLRSTIIGDCLARIFEFHGLDVVRLNHVGDFGTSFGMLIAYMKQFERDVVDGKKAATLQDLVAWYKSAKKTFDEDETFKKASQLEVVKLQSGEKEAVELWKTICEISRIAFREIYDLLDIHLIERGESFYKDELKNIVDLLDQKGLVTISDGAKCVFLEGFKNREGNTLPLMVQKSDGGYTYDTTDIAALLHRVKDEKASRIIYVTDQGQSEHFHMVFALGEKAGIYDPSKVRLDHVGFGLVLGQDGKKFRTRAGDTEKLIDLLNTAIDEAKKILQERTKELSGEALLTAAKTLGLSAVKYADLSTNRMSDYVFSYDKMLKFEGNTAAFIMYSYVRVLGIERKINKDTESLKKSGKITLSHPSEISLGLHLTKFIEVLETCEETLLPNRLTEYLYLLAEKFNAFFRDCRVEGSEEETSRLLLCIATKQTLKKGLELLGIGTLERM